MRSEYLELYYLGGIDLMPRRLADYPHKLSNRRCEKLYRQGWLFHTKEDALRAREVMRRAYVDAVMAAKGSDCILFKRLWSK